MLASVTRVSLQSSRRSSSLSTIDETLSAPPVGVLSADREFSVNVDPSTDQDQGSSDSLVSSVLSTSGQTFQCSSSFRDRHYRRFTGGLGRSLSGVGDFGRLESS